MASFHPHFCSDYQFSPDEFSEIMSVMVQENYGSGGTLSSATISSFSGDENNNFKVPTIINHDNDDFGLDGNFPIDSSVLEMQAPVVSGFPECIGVSDLTVPVLHEEYLGMGHVMNNGIAKIQSFDSYGGGLQSLHVREYGEDYCYGNFVPSFKATTCPTSNENWGIQYRRSMQAYNEQTNIKVGRYTEEERKDRIDRYLKKRNQRNFNKTIKYACRKTLADRRVRVRGRFARNIETCDEENQHKKNDCIDNNNTDLHEKDSYSDDTIQIKNDDDDQWLEEAVASLMYVPYVNGRSIGQLIN